MAFIRRRFIIILGLVILVIIICVVGLALLGPSIGCIYGGPTPLWVSHPAYVRAIFSPDAQTLVIVDKNYAIHVGHVSPKGYQEIAVQTTTMSVTPDSCVFEAVLAISPNGRYVAYAVDSFTQLWDLQTNVIHEYDGYGFHCGGAIGPAFAFSPDSKRLAVGDSFYNAQLIDTASGGEIGLTMTDAPPANPRIPGVWGWRFGAIAFSPDGKTLASSGCSDRVPGEYCAAGEFSLWNTSTQQKISEVVGGNAPEASMLAYSPDGNTLVEGGGGVSLLNANDLKPKQSFNYLCDWSSSGGSLAFNADWSLVAVPFNGVYMSDSNRMDQVKGSVGIWNTVTGQNLAELDHGSEIALAAAFDPSGHVVSVSGDGILRFWEIQQWLFGTNMNLISTVRIQQPVIEF